MMVYGGRDYARFSGEFKGEKVGRLLPFQKKKKMCFLKFLIKYLLFLHLFLLWRI